MKATSLPLVLGRRTARISTAQAGCYVCHGDRVQWTSANAQALAAQHHDRTGHHTWCEIALSVRYGRAAPDDRQIDIEEAIASASSGDAPVCAALTDLDAPAVPAAGVSAPQGRSSKPALAAAKPETFHA